ncbi:MAG: ATP-binding protein [Candidatus Stygibacter australis]|nr:ATP-binding protein [Candidatus Stygibacter australis]
MMSWWQSMNNLLNISAGKLKLKDRPFIFQLDSALTIASDSEKKLLLISGDNGSGKTTFLEQIIIPDLKQNKIFFSFKGQDSHIQNLIDRSLKAIFSLSQSGKKLFSQILFNAPISTVTREIEIPAVDVILMDETDKLLSDEDMRVIFNDPAYQLLILVSHNLDNPFLQNSLSNFKQQFRLHIEGQSNIRKARLSQC